MAEDSPRVRLAERRLGRVLSGKWTLERLIGVGGMASVYAATHRNGSRVAIKILHAETASSEDAVRRFLREGYASNSIDHPATVKVLDDDLTEDGSPFLVMEMLEGENLATRLARHVTMDVGEVLSTIERVLDALAIAHPIGIVHRDIKPDNIFITRDGQVKILDFGIARMRDQLGTGKQTTAGTAMGTPAYMSPEQARGRWDEVDAQSDIWSLGSTMYELLTGVAVHEAATINEMLLAAMTHQARPVRERARNLAPNVAAIVDRALAFEKSGRFASAAEMRDAIRAAQDGPQVTPPVAAPAPPESPVDAATIHRPPLVSTPILDPATGTLRATYTPQGSALHSPRTSVFTKGLLASAVLTGIIGVSIVVLWTTSSDPETVGALASPETEQATPLAPLPAPPEGDPAPPEGSEINTDPEPTAEPATTAAPKASAEPSPSAKKPTAAAVKLPPVKPPPDEATPAKPPPAKPPPTKPPPPAVDPRIGM